MGLSTHYPEDQGGPCNTSLAPLLNVDRATRASRSAIGFTRAEIEHQGGARRADQRKHQASPHRVGDVAVSVVWHLTGLRPERRVKSTNADQNTHRYRNPTTAATFRSFGSAQTSTLKNLMPTSVTNLVTILPVSASAATAVGQAPRLSGLPRTTPHSSIQRRQEAGRAARRGRPHR